MRRQTTRSYGEYAGCSLAGDAGDLDDDWAEVLRIFPWPWKMHDVPDGGVWLEDATGKAIVYIYHRRKDVANWKKPKP